MRKLKECTSRESEGPSLCIGGRRNQQISQKAKKPRKAEERNHQYSPCGRACRGPATSKYKTSIIGCAVMTGAGAVENSADVQPGQSVAVIGVGGVGLSAVVAAKARGASPIIAIDLDDEKLQFAKAMGATHLVNAAEEDPVEAVRRLTARSDEWAFRGVEVAGADFVFDCIGRRVTMEQAVPAVRSGFFGVSQGGTAVLVGVPTTEMTLNATDLLMHEKRFIGSLGGSCTPDVDFPRYVDWVRRGRLDLDQMITERFSLGQINEATRALDAGEIKGRAILEFDQVG